MISRIKSGRSLISGAEPDPIEGGRGFSFVLRRNKLRILRNQILILGCKSLILLNKALIALLKGFNRIRVAGRNLVLDTMRVVFDLIFSFLLFPLAKILINLNELWNKFRHRCQRSKEKAGHRCEYDLRNGHTPNLKRNFTPVSPERREPILLRHRHLFRVWCTVRPGVCAVAAAILLMSTHDNTLMTLYDRLCAVLWIRWMIRSHKGKEASLER